MNGGRTGKLDALAKCTLLETLNLYGCNGYDHAADKRVSEGLTGTWHRSLTAEAVNANIRISDACADTCILFCADFSGLSALVNLTTLNLRYTYIREFPDASRPKSCSCT